MKGKTSTGFEFDIDDRAVRDVRFLDMAAAVYDESATPMDKVRGFHALVSLLLSDEQKDALYAHVSAQNDGYVPIDALERELTEIVSGGGKASKN